MISPRKKYLIKIFLKKTRYGDLYDYAFGCQFELLKHKYSFIPSKELEELKESYNSDKYFDKIVPIVDTYFTEEELKEIVDFYMSPAGAKTMNKVMALEVSKIAQQIIVEIEHKMMKLNKGKQA